MQGQGWVKLWRKSVETQIFKNAGLWQFWTWCLLSASYEAETVPVKVGRRTVRVQLQPGQLAFGRKSVGKKLGVSASTALFRLRKFVNLGMLKVDNRGDVDTKVTVVSVVNWSTYQGSLENRCPPIDTKLAESVDTKADADNAVIPAACQEFNCQPGPQTPPKRRHPRSIYKEDSSPKPLASGEGLRLSNLLADLILTNNPKSVQLRSGKREDSVRRWANDLDKLHRIDGQDWADIERVVRWCQSDDFWSKNVLSGATLRKQWDRLYLRIEPGSPQAPDWRSRFAEAPD